MIQYGTRRRRRSASDKTPDASRSLRGAPRGPVGSRVAWVLGSILTACALSAVTARAAGAPAQSMPAPQHYDISAGRLDGVLKEFASHATVMLSADAALTAGKSSAGLHGDYTVAQGFAALLAGSGLQAVADGEGGYSIEVAAPAAAGNTLLLPSVKVKGTAEDATITEGTGSYTTQAVTIGGKSARDPKEVQQSISVLTQQRIQDQDITNLAGAMSQITGVTVVSDANSQAFYSRGFMIGSLQFDGGSPTFLNNNNNNSYAQNVPDLAPYDHVEVLRGADGLFAGAGEASGSINLVRKRPLDQNQVLFDVLGGSWDHYRVQLDATGPLAWDGRVRGRVVAAYEGQHYFYDIAKDNKTVLYGIVEADLTPTTLLSVGGSFQQDNSIPNYRGLPRSSTGADLHLPRSTCLCTSWSYWNTSTPEVFAKLEQSFGTDWSLKLNVSERSTRFDAKYPYPSGSGVDPTSGGGEQFWEYKYDDSPRQTLADVAVNGRFSVLGSEQELVFGASWQNIVDTDGSPFTALVSSFPSLDVLHYNPADYPDPGTPAHVGSISPQLGQEQTGVYTTLRSQITSGLHSIVGVRYSNYLFRDEFNSYDTSTGDVTYNANWSFRLSHVWTPYGGLTYDLTKSVSLYGSYARIFQPQPYYVTAAGKPLAPITGNTYELGAKGSWLSGALTASVAAYDVERHNAAEFEPDVSASFGAFSCCYAAAAEVRSRGIDAELTGAPLPGWQVYAGYTYNINQQRSGYGTTDGAAFMPQTPKHLLKLWTMTQLPGAASSVRVGGGVTAQTKNYVTGTSCSQLDSNLNCIGSSVPFQFTQTPYAVISLRGEYRINASWTAAVNLNNLLDRVYYQTVASPSQSNFYGEPRNFMLSLHGQF